MKTVNFTLDEKPEMINVKWYQDEYYSDWWCEDEIEEGTNLQEGDYICIDGFMYFIYRRVYHLHEGVWTYYLDPLFQYND
jgi:hypothetical protein